MEISVNGEQKAYPGPLSIDGLLAALSLAPAKIAVERNLEIIAKSRYGETMLADGDRIEIVQFVGGG